MEVLAAYYVVYVGLRNVIQYLVIQYDLYYILIMGMLMGTLYVCDSGI